MRRRIRWSARALGAAALALAVSGIPGPAAQAAPAPSAAASAPTGRATATLTKLGDVDVRLRGNFPGAAGSQASFSTPTVADVTGDGVPEIVSATVDGRVIAYRADRTVLWTYDAGATSIQSAPAVSDITGDGKADVVVGTMDGRVIALHGPNGQLYRTFADGGLQGCQPTCFPRGFHATPAIGDVNGDGIMDIVASSYNHFLYAWSRGGTRLFMRNLYDTIWSSPVIADIDRNGTNEVIVGGDVDASNPVLGGPSGGMIWVIRRDGSTYGNYAGYPKRIPGQTLWSTPAVADVNGDGNLDIVIGSGIFYPDPAGRQVTALTARTGAALPGWPEATEGRVLGSPAVGDVTGDGKPEVAVTSEGGWLHVFNPSGTRRWVVCDRSAGSGCAAGVGTFTSPVLADVDRDGEVEVITTTENVLRIRDGNSGTVEAQISLAPTDGGLPTVPWSSPTVAEIGGSTQIVYQSHVRRGHSGPYARSGDTHRLQVLTTSQRLCRAPWPTFKGGPVRTGRSWEPANPAWLPFSCPGDFVEQQYQDFLGRAADQSGRAYWSTLLREGKRTGAKTITGFLRSPEFGEVVAPVVRVSFALQGTFPQSAAQVRTDAGRLRRGTALATVAQDAVDQDQVLDAMDDTAFVTEIYQNLYGRAPTSSELGTGVGQLSSGTARGAFVVGLTEGAVARYVLAVPVDVTMVYLGMLDRRPDQGGFDFWVTETVARGPDRLISGFQASPEYRARVL